MNAEAPPRARRSPPSSRRAAKGLARPPVAPPPGRANLRACCPNLQRFGRSSRRLSAGPLAGALAQRVEDEVLVSTCGARCVGPGLRASGLKPKDLGRTVGVAPSSRNPAQVGPGAGVAESQALEASPPRGTSKGKRREPHAHAGARAYTLPPPPQGLREAKYCSQRQPVIPGECLRVLKLSSLFSS